MDKEIREKIALKRYQLISPVLAEHARAQNEYFRNSDLLFERYEEDFPDIDPYENPNPFEPEKGFVKNPLSSSPFGQYKT